MTPLHLEKFITETLWNFKKDKITYDEAVVKFGEMFVKVYELTIEEKLTK